MSSPRDEGREPQASNDAPAENSTNEGGSAVDSVQTPRSLAENLKRPEVNATEKKVKDAVEQLASLQESVRKLNEIRSRIHQTSVDRETETKKKNPPKTGSSNVIQFPVPARSDERASAPEQSSVPKSSMTVPHHGTHGPAPGLEEFDSGSSQPIPEAPSPPVAELSELSRDTSDQEVNQPTKLRTEIVENVAQDQPVFTDPPAKLNVPTAEPEEEEPEALDPEVLAANTPATLEDRIVSSRRSAAVDSEIRALVKQYGEADIYSNRQEGGKQILIKAAVAGFLLIAVLAVSYLFLL